MNRPRKAFVQDHATPSPVMSDGNGHWYNSEDYTYGDEADVGETEDEPRERKRQRVSKACNACRKKKVRCDGNTPTCSHCASSKTTCVYSQVEKKRAPPKGAKYIEGLENRLGRMESLLRLTGVLAEHDDRTDLGMLEKRLQENQQSDVFAQRRLTPLTDGSPTKSPPQAASTNAEAGAQPAKSVEVDALAEDMCSLITNQSGETRYIGSSSGFSIFSPKGIQWVNAKTGDTSFEHMIASAAANEQKWDHWRPEVFNDIFIRRVFKPLPAREQCFILLKSFFANFNTMFPLFHEPTFMHLARRHYAGGPDLGSGWWASLNVALAISHRLRVMSNTVHADEDLQAWGYLKNAMGVMTELTMRNTDLLSVQALLGMSLFLQGTPNPQPSFFLVSAAIRLSHSIGLHKRGSGFKLNSEESEQRKRVFWIAYLLDKDICLRSGRPPAQDDDDMNVELPSEDPADNIGVVPLLRPTEDGKMTMNLFRHMCTFAQIQSRVYKQLYSVKASKQSDGELLNTIGELDEALESWKNSIPEDFRPEREIRAQHTALIVHVVVLHFAYYNCLTTIHRMSVHHGYWTRGLGDYAIRGLNARPLNPRVFLSAALCVNAARTSIGLIRYIPQGDYACVWLILYYPVSSLVTIFANILQNPQDARARSDLRLMSSVVSFLTMLEADVHEQNGNVRRMLSVCSEFERIASVVLERSEREMKGRGKRKQAERERERDRANGEVSAELEGGKTLEQLQIETQSSYRRPISTPSMRSASVNGSATGVADQTASRTLSDQGMSQPTMQQGQPATFSSPSVPMMGSMMQDMQPGMEAVFDQGVKLQPFDSNLGMGGSAGDFPMPQNHNNARATGPDSYQQPFVPQDLWQMPMTLEWDWADMNLMGGFTPGPYFSNDGVSLGPTDQADLPGGYNAGGGYPMSQ